MRLIRDTHALIWWLNGSAALSAKAQAAIADDNNAAFVSAASAWELTTKHRVGKLPDAAKLVNDIGAVIAGQNFAEMTRDSV